MDTLPIITIQDMIEDHDQVTVEARGADGHVVDSITTQHPQDAISFCAVYDYVRVVSPA